MVLGMRTGPPHEVCWGHQGATRCGRSFTRSSIKGGPAASEPVSRTTCHRRGHRTPASPPGGMTGPPDHPCTSALSGPVSVPVDRRTRAGGAEHSGHQARTTGGDRMNVQPLLDTPDIQEDPARAQAYGLRARIGNLQSRWRETVSLLAHLPRDDSPGSRIRPNPRLASCVVLPLGFAVVTTVHELLAPHCHAHNGRRRPASRPRPAESLLVDNPDDSGTPGAAAPPGCVPCRASCVVRRALRRSGELWVRVDPFRSEGRLGVRR